MILIRNLNAAPHIPGIRIVFSRDKGVFARIVELDMEFTADPADAGQGNIPCHGDIQLGPGVIQDFSVRCQVRGILAVFIAGTTVYDTGEFRAFERFSVFLQQGKQVQFPAFDDLRILAAHGNPVGLEWHVIIALGDQLITYVEGVRVFSFAAVEVTAHFARVE